MIFFKKNGRYALSEGLKYMDVKDIFKIKYNIIILFNFYTGI
jgi:hypothetical protein